MIDKSARRIIAISSPTDTAERFDERARRERRFRTEFRRPRPGWFSSAPVEAMLAA
jgi:hypothetical protein